MALTTLQRPHPTAPTVVHQPTFLGRVALAVLAHRRLVLVAWMVLLVLGGAAASAVSNRLSVDFSLPGQPGYETSVKILSIYHNGGENPPSVAVVTVPPGPGARADQARTDAAFAGLRQAQPSLRVVDYGVTHNPALYHRRRPHDVRLDLRAAGQVVRRRPSGHGGPVVPAERPCPGRTSP